MTINCKGKLINLESPKIMGILNITPDSFYDGGRFTDETALLKQVEKMLDEGASFIDLGAYSSRPGATDISEEEELSRLETVLNTILIRFPGVLISIDTFRSSIARYCLEVGAAMINDISGGDRDPAMLQGERQCSGSMPGKRTRPPGETHSHCRLPGRPARDCRQSCGIRHDPTEKRP